MHLCKKKDLFSRLIVCWRIKGEVEGLKEKEEVSVGIVMDCLLMHTSHQKHCGDRGERIRESK